MADRLDVVAVGVADEGAVVVVVVLREVPGLVEHLCAEGHRGLEEARTSSADPATKATWISRLGPAAGPSSGWRPIQNAGWEVP